MSRDFDEINPDNIEGEPDSKLLKWMSVLILVLAVGGFFALAWYAYHTGTNQTEIVQSEENLDLVRADADPIKEAPEDPGGQQFPHQDKTVFNAISGAEKPSVERILPASEEPIDRGDKVETETWMNDRLSKSQETPTPTHPGEKVENAQATEEPAGPVTQFDPSSVKSTTTPTPVTNVPPVPAAETKQEPVAAPVKEEPKVETAEPVKEVVKPVAQKPVVEKPVVEKATPAAEVPKVSQKVSGVRAQLGAFKSQGEAEENWGRIRAKYASKLSEKEHRVLRVDLGAKGIFYRLHVMPFSSAGNAQSFCGSIAPQPCFVAGK